MPELNKSRKSQGNQNSGQIKKIPTKYRKYLLADFGGDILEQIADKNKLNTVNLFDLTGIVTAIFIGQNKVIDLPKLLKEQIKVTDKKANELAIEIAAKRLLVADEYFKGAVSRFLKKMGADPSAYSDIVKEYVNKTNQEIKQEKQLALEEKYIPPVRREEETFQTNPLDFKTPQEAADKMKQLLQENVLLMLTTDTTEVKAALNIEIVKLLVEEERYQKEFINALSKNNEEIGSEDILYKNEKVRPTVENWIADLVFHLNLGEEQALSSIQKAKYYAENPNVKMLSQENRELLDKVFDLYENLINFYNNSEKMTYAEIQIYPLTQDELEYLQKTYFDNDTDDNNVNNSKPKDVYDYYQGDIEQTQKIEETKKEIIQQTNQEAAKVADLFYEYLLKRNRLGLIAGVQVLVEIGVLDDLLAHDKRFQDLLKGYFKRNNLTQELSDFEKNNGQQKFVKDFLKYLFLERLAMDENEAARIAVHIGNIFRQQGVKELSQLAYFDLEKKQFNWI